MEIERVLRSVNSHLRLSDYECSIFFQPSLRWALHFIPTHLTSPKKSWGGSLGYTPPVTVTSNTVDERKPAPPGTV